MDAGTILTSCGFAAVTVAFIAAVLTYIRRLIFQRSVKLNQIYPLGHEANRLFFQIDSPTSATVFTTSKKKVYKITKSNTRWYIQSSSSNKMILCTLKNSVKEKFIVINKQNPLSRNSPLGTSPSVLKYDTTWVQWLLDHLAGGIAKSDFSFGDSITLRWVSSNHFEIITKENSFFGRSEQQVDVHRRVAYVSEIDENNQTGFNIWFSYDMINIEILISTFLFSLVVQRSELKGLLKPKVSKTTSIA